MAKRPWSTLTAILQGFALVLFCSSANAGPKEDLAKAEDYFLVTDYASALSTVRPLIVAGVLQGEDLRNAHVLQARCELALGRASSATDAFCEALRIDPNWRPDATFSAEEARTFSVTASTCTTDRGLAVRPGGPGESSQLPKSGTKRWYKSPKVLGAIAGVVAASVALSLSKGDEKGASGPTLSPYPDPPPSK